MVILDTTAKLIEVALDAAPSVNELHWIASWADMDATTFVPGAASGLTTGTTPVTVVAAPASATQRQVKFLSVFNTDTSNATLTLRLDTGGTDRTLWRGVLAPGEAVQFVDRQGFSVRDAAGVPKLISTGVTVTTYAQWAGIAAGTANARTLAPIPAITAYATGQAFEFLNGAASNTGAATLAVSGLATRAVLRPNGAALIGGDLPADTLIMVRYDGAAFRIANLLIGAASESAAGVLEIANATEADAGTDNTRAMTPLRVAQRRVASATKSASYTVVPDDNGRLILLSGAFTLSLNATSILGAGFTVHVHNTGTGNWLVNPFSLETINGQLSLTLPPGASCTIVCTGTGFHTVGLSGTYVYDSGAQTMTAGGPLTLAHGLGAAPAIGDISTALECTTAQANWVVGDFIQMGSGSRTDWDGTAHAGYVIWADATNIYVRFHLTNVALLFNKTTGAAAVATPTSWRLHIRAVRRLP